jgi:hypothetical protein
LEMHFLYDTAVETVMRSSSHTRSRYTEKASQVIFKKEDEAASPLTTAPAAVEPLRAPWTRLKDLKSNDFAVDLPYGISRLQHLAGFGVL